MVDEQENSIPIPANHQTRTDMWAHCRGGIYSSDYRVPAILNPQSHSHQQVAAAVSLARHPRNATPHPGDEDITPSVAPVDPPTIMQGPSTRA